MTKLLRNPLVIISLLFFVLIVLVWFAGPRFGLVRLDLRLFLILALMVLWVVMIVLLSKKNPVPGSELQTPSLQPPQIPAPTLQAPAPPTLAAPSVNVPTSISGASPRMNMTAPAQNEEIDGFRNQLDRAAQWLRTSKLAKLGGDVLYRLPWYLVLGPTGSGKSMLVGQSELDFPYTDPDRSMGKRGIEPTRNVDVWIANEAVFVDTAGKISSGEGQKDAWLQVLGQLKRVRREKPLDGLILAADISAVLQMGEDQLKELSRRLRSRLDEATQQLGLSVPVYLIFTKCDLLDGFQEYFNDLNDEERQKVWGCTLKREQYQSLQPHQEFEKEYDLLCRELVNRRLLRLTTRANERKEKIYSFPLQLALARNQLVDFVTFLFQPSTFRERPIFRGFYLTSAIQTRAALDLVADYMDRHAAIPPARVSSDTVKETNGYFINQTLTQVIFPDRVLSGTSSTARRRGLLIRICLLVALGIVLPIILWLVISSYSQNQALLTSIEKARSSPSRPGKTHEEIQILEELRTQLERLDDCPLARGRPSFQWGMYIGDRVLEPARRIYAERLKQDFILSTGQNVKIDLRNDSNSTRAIYHLLKTYLMMSESGPIRAEEKYLSSNESPLTKFWLQQVQSADMPEAEKQLSFYLHMLTYHKDPEYLVSRNNVEDAQLISLRRDYLLTFDVVANYYNILKAEGNRKAIPMTVGRALDGKDLELIDGSYEVPGSFTRNGYDTAGKDLVKAMAEEYDRGVWVLAKPAMGVDPQKPPKEAMEARLNELYFNDYAREWWNFLRSIKVHAFQDRKDGADRLGKLTRSQDSPIYRLFKTVSTNTWDDLEGKSTGNRNQEDLVLMFKPVHHFVAAADNQKPAISQYLDVVGRVYKELYAYVGAGEPPTQIGTLNSAVAEALGQTGVLMQNFTPDSSSVVKPLLEQPIRMALTLTPPVTDSSAPATSPTLAPLTPPSPTSGGVAGGLVIRGIVSSRTTGSPLDKAVLYLLKAGSTEVTLNNYLTLASSDGSGTFQFPKAMPPGKYALFVKARGYKTVSQDIELSKASSALKIALAPE